QPDEWSHPLHTNAQLEQTVEIGVEVEHDTVGPGDEVDASVVRVLEQRAGRGVQDVGQPDDAHLDAVGQSMAGRPAELDARAEPPFFGAPWRGPGFQGYGDRDQRHGEPPSAAPLASPASPHISTV